MLLERACDEIARVTRARASCSAKPARDLRRCSADAGSADRESPISRLPSQPQLVRCTPGVASVVFSPLFPVSLDDRARFAALVARAR